MEDMARLALVEQSVRDMETFSKILYELLRHINCILENPHDYEVRTIRSDGLKKFLQYQALVDYLVSIGFQPVKNEYTYPKENTLNNLRMAQAAIERKIYFCCGSMKNIEKSSKSLQKIPKLKEPKLLPVNVLRTRNNLLQRIQAMFNDLLQYEDEDLQAVAREHIPLVTLQLMALDDMREHQRKIKTGELKGRDLPFDIALLKVLLSWFKHRFFTWVDTPPCHKCGGNTKPFRNSSMNTGIEICKVEVYRCMECNSEVDFPRYKHPLKLLESRRGRCGEWANCFTLLCRSLGYDTRLVFDNNDHVWCEIWDYDSGKWLHADPCEGVLDTPLIYSHGWGKKLRYVIAYSRDDLQDVTWRYTTEFAEVRSRRTEVRESELLDAIQTMRAARQKTLPEARRKYLAKRCLMELAELITERKVCESELHGRISGSATWRSRRGELGAQRHVFRLSAPGPATITYCAVTDTYVIQNGEDLMLPSWASGAFTAERIFRKVEKDWKMVYLARLEGTTAGSISWAVEAAEGRALMALSIRARTATYEDGRVTWTVQLDNHEPTPVNITEQATEFSGRFTRALLTARLSGGRGHTAWQHAQLCRQPLDAPAPTLAIQVTVVKDS